MAKLDESNSSIVTALMVISMCVLGVISVPCDWLPWPLNVVWEYCIFYPSLVVLGIFVEIVWSIAEFFS